MQGRDARAAMILAYEPERLGGWLAALSILVLAQEPRSIDFREVSRDDTGPTGS